MDARDEANGDLDVFFATAGLDNGPQSKRVASERIRWMDAALEAWFNFVADTGMVSHDEIQAVHDRIDIDTRKRDE